MRSPFHLFYLNWALLLGNLSYFHLLLSTFFFSQMLFSELNGLLGWATKAEQIDSRMAVHPFGLSSLSPPLPPPDPFSPPSSPSPSPFPAFVNVCLEGLSANQKLPLAVVHAELQRTAPSWTATALHLLLGERLPVREEEGGGRV